MPIYSIDGIVPVVHESAFVHPDAVLIGDVIIEAGCYVAPCAVMRGDMGRLLMLEGSNLQDGCIVHSFPNCDAAIGPEGHIGHGAILHGCIVRRGALVGMNATVMDDVEVGEYAIVAANAYVNTRMKIPPGMLAAGVPARVVREVTADEREWKRLGTQEYHTVVKRSFESLRRVAEPLRQVEADRPRPRVGDLKPLYRHRQNDN